MKDGNNSLIKKSAARSQAGIAVGLIVSIIGLLGLIALTISLSVSNSSSNTDEQKIEADASIILEQSNNLAMTASFLMAQNPDTAGASQITVDTDSATGIYGKGGLGTMNPKGVGGITSTSWGNTLSADALFVDDSFTGTTANDYYAAVDGVSSAVCNEINDMLNITPATAGDPLVADFADKGYQAGCFLTATGAATGRYFRVVQSM